MKTRFRKTLIARSRFIVFVAEPPTQPSAGVNIHRTVGFADRSQTEVVGPSGHHSIELPYDRLPALSQSISSGFPADRAADTLHPLLRWFRAEINSTPSHRVAVPERVPQKVELLSGSLQTRVLFSFTVNFSFDIILRIAVRACSAPVRQQMTRSSA